MLVNEECQRTFHDLVRKITMIFFLDSLVRNGNLYKEKHEII